MPSTLRRSSANAYAKARNVSRSCTWSSSSMIVIRLPSNENGSAGAGRLNLDVPKKRGAGADCFQRFNRRHACHAWSLAGLCNASASTGEVCQPSGDLALEACWGSENGKIGGLGRQRTTPAPRRCNIHGNRRSKFHLANSFVRGQTPCLVVFGYRCPHARDLASCCVASIGLPARCSIPQGVGCSHIGRRCTRSDCIKQREIRSPVIGDDEL